jgi:hypothetical protein
MDRSMRTVLGIAVEDTRATVADYRDRGCQTIEPTCSEQFSGRERASRPRPH